MTSVAFLMAANVAQGQTGSTFSRSGGMHRAQPGTQSKTRASKQGPHTLEAKSALVTNGREAVVL